MGFLFQSAALFDSLSVGENVAFPMRRHTDWSDDTIRDRARQKLAGRRARHRLRQDARATCRVG